MPLFLQNRDTDGRERMDCPDCDVELLQNTYRQFSTVNKLISEWRRIYKKHIYPFLTPHQSYHFLDIGFGGGDIPIMLAQLLSREGIDFQITAIDPDPRAVNYVQSLDHPPNIRFQQRDVAALDPGENKFDFVLSNHLLHHLEQDKLNEYLSRAKQLSTKAVIFNDIHRSDWAFLLFNILSRPFFRDSFITEDGLTSIKRSFTAEELEQLVPSDWQVTKLFPFRLLLMYQHN